MDRLIDVQTVCHGRYQIWAALVEMRMSHWVNTFVIRDAITHEAVLDTGSNTWDLENYREENNQLILIFRIYPEGNVSYTLTVDFDLQKIIYEGQLYDFNSLNTIISK
ncbi:hypothetical protein [Myroides odoratimimus]|uniref:Uncharacterized protein n=1 Tax=Myroides odoratimimus CCUG 10230 TaxID=883150 RepID=A0ABP2NAB7_9FLAO|nr:hypothetical protein [Myroides odoratimimus]EHO08602.1 hypothetical protein HMPREF9712_02264 [Myroides odoratimimus CCUG 10230]